MDDKVSSGEDRANVIAKVDGNSTIDAVRAFPKAESATVPIIQILGKTIDGQEVLVTYERYSYRHYKSKFWAWRMTRAVLVTDPKAGRDELAGAAFRTCETHRSA